MRSWWIVTITSVLVSMGLVLVNVGQYQEMVRAQSQIEKKQDQIQLSDERLANQEFFRKSLEKLDEEAKNSFKVRESAASQAVSKAEEMKKKHNDCQADKTNVNTNVEEQEIKYTETEDTLKSETESWNKEIETLKKQLKDFSPICKHVKQDALADKLCGIQRPKAPEAPAAPAKVEAPAAPAKVEAPAAPAKPEAPAAPAKVEAPAASAKVEAPAAPAKPQ